MQVAAFSFIAFDRFRDGLVIRRSRGYTEGALILYRSRIWTSSLTIDQKVNRWKSCRGDEYPISRFVPLGVATGMQLAKSYSKNPYNEEVQVYELTGGVELVPLLTTRRYCSRSKGARHIATDATRPGCTIDSYVLSWNSWNCCFQELLFVCISDFWFSLFGAKSIIREKVRYLLGFAFILEFWKRCEMNLDEILLNSKIFWINFGWNTKHLTKIIKN